MPEVIVVGAGIAGLSCAWNLHRSGLDVLVLEAASRVGGVIQSHKIKGYLVESGPNTVLPTASWAAVIRELGLDDEVSEAPAHSPRFVYIDGRLRKVPFSVLSPRGLLRVAAEPFIAAGCGDDETLASFFTRRFGREVHERLAAPFVTGIYAGDTRQLSLEATFPRMAELERRYRSVILGMLLSQRSITRSRLSSFRNGMETLPLRLAEGLDVRCGVGDVNLADGLKVEWGSNVASPKALVLSVPAYVASALMKPLSLELAHTLGRVTYAPMVVAAMSISEQNIGRRLDGFGFLIPRSESFHILGTLFSSSLFPNRAPAAEPEVHSIFKRLYKKHLLTIKILRDAMTCEEGVVEFDISNHEMEGHNKFIPYYVFPECVYTVGLSLGHTRSKVSVGTNPWTEISNRHNLAALCERYGGGGHSVVAAISFKPEELDVARKTAREIAEILRHEP